MTKTFTGRHMLAIIVGFLVVVIAVNLVMARFAITTFGGTVVDNSYVASQKFNRWLDEAQAQSTLGWRLTADRSGDHAVVSFSGAPDVQIDGTAIHPLGRLPSMTLHFGRTARGRFRSLEQLPAGRWRLEFRVIHGVRHARFLDEVSA